MREISQKDDLIVLDSSAISKEKVPITQALYTAFDGLNIIEFNELFEGIQRMNGIVNIANQGNLVVIQEVVEESTEHLRILNQQRSFIHKRLDDKKSTKRDRYGDLGRCERNSILEAIRGYTNTLYRLINRISDLDPRDNMTHLEERHYLGMLNMVRSFSWMSNGNGFYGKRQEYSHQSGVRKKLEADNKIIATAFFLAYKKPITILTRDLGLCAIADRITREMPCKNFRKRFYLPFREMHQVRFRDLE